MASRRFRHGGVTYPITASTANTLIEDADPALYFASQLFTFALKRYVGPRLIAEAKKIDGLRIPSAVESTIEYEPSPFVLGEQIEFPIFCLYRVEDEWSRVSASHVKSVSTWEWAYVLPPLTPRGIKAVQPILRSVAATIAALTFASFDPDFEGGATLRDLSGLMSIKPGPARYGDFERLEGEAQKWWRAVTGQLIVEERNDFVLEDEEMFDGADITIDLAKKHAETVEAFLEARTDPPPVVESIGPIEGTKAGGTPFRIVGRNFVPGSRPRVLIGGAAADSVVVTHATEIVGLAPPTESANPTFDADVQIIAADGQLSNVLAGAFRYTTP